MSKTLLAIILASLALGCATDKASRRPSQEFNVKLRDSKGNVKQTSSGIAVQNTPDSPDKTVIGPSDEETRREAEAMKSAIAHAVQKAEANHDRTTGVAVSQPAVPVKPPALATVKNVASPGSPSDVPFAKATPTLPQTSSPGPQRKVGAVSAEQALKWLKNGNRRFVRGALRNDGASSKDRARLTVTQAPHAFVITTSDSRVPPEIIFDQKLGEIFVLRLADGEVDSQVQKSLREGVGNLGANLVVVLGVNSLRNWENPRGLARDLTENSEILRSAVASGGVKIVPALYNLETGSVTWAE